MLKLPQSPSIESRVPPGLGLLLVLSACVLGCSHRTDEVGSHKTGFVGTWRNSIAGNGSYSTMTFNADHTMSFVATNGPKQAQYKLSGLGTWSASGDSLTVVPLSMQLENVTPAARAKLQPYLDAQIHVPQTAPVVWKGTDAFVQTKNGVEQNFKRVD
jgi:hypothetical protein